MADALWIKLSTSLPRHPKTRAFAAALKISVPSAIGHLAMMWIFALEYFDDGILPRAEISKAAGWEGGQEDFIKALLTAGDPSGREGFIDPIPSTTDFYKIHDWEKYSGVVKTRRKKVMSIIDDSRMIAIKKHREEKIREEKEKRAKATPEEQAAFAAHLAEWRAKNVKKE